MKPPRRGRSRPTPGLSKSARFVARPGVADLFENEAVFLCTHDLEGVLLSINDASRRALGYSEEELLGRSIRDVLAPEYRGEFDGYLARLRSSGAATGVMTVASRNGERRFWHYQNVLRPEGLSGGVVYGTAIDVTELILAERSAQKMVADVGDQIRRQALIFENLHDALILTDLDGIIVDWNAGAERMHGIARADAVGKRISIVAPSERENADRIREAALREGRWSGEVEIKRADGKPGVADLVVVALRNSSGEIVGTAGISRDISNRKDFEERLRLSEERYRHLFERSLAGIYRTALDGTILDSNEAYLEILGYNDRNELLSGNARDHYFFESEREIFVSEVLEKGKATNLEVCLKRRDGTAVWVLENVSLVQGPSGAFLEGSLINISDRKRVEEALRLSEERYRFLFESNPLPMWVYEIDSLKLLDVNAAAIAHYGYSRAEFLSMRLPEIWPPEDRDRHPIAPVARKPQPFTESRHVLKNGRIIDVDVSAVDLAGEHARRRMALARDVTEQRSAEQALVESERKYRHIFDLAPIGIYQVKADGQFLTVNSAFARMLGYTPDELVREHSAYDLYFDASERDSAIREFNEYPGPGKTIERRLKSRTGEPVWLRITAQVVRNERTGTEYLEGFTFDITEKKRVEEQQARLQAAVLESARQWRDTFDAIDTPVLVCDQRGVVKRLNRAAVELTGQTYVDVLGKRLDDLGAGELWKTTFELVYGGEAGPSRPGVLCRDETAQRTWEISVSGFDAFESQKEPLAIVTLRDITATVRLQESVMRAESMSSMGSLVAGVAHEVRNPLFAISATLDAFDARFRDRDDYKKYAQAFRTQLDRMNSLMRDLLDYGRPAVLELRDVPPEELARDAVRGCSDLALRSDIPVEIDAPHGLPSIRVDRGRTVQVLINLIENAIQHSPEKRPVEVRAEALDRAGLRGVRFTVEDHGPGFQASDLPKLFDPFFTKRQGGTGLGLAIVRRIVDEHGGTISPANRPDGGASISVWLPCAPPEAGKTERKA